MKRWLCIYFTGFCGKINFINVFWVVTVIVLQILDETHWENLSFIFNQFISLNSETLIHVVFTTGGKEFLRQKKFLFSRFFCHEHLDLELLLELYDVAKYWHHSLKSVRSRERANPTHFKGNIMPFSCSSSTLSLTQFSSGYTALSVFCN